VSDVGIVTESGASSGKRNVIPPGNYTAVSVSLVNSEDHLNSLPTQVFNEFVAPESPVIKQQKTASRRKTLNETNPKPDAVIRKSTRRSAQLMQLDKFVMEDSSDDSDVSDEKDNVTSKCKAKVVVESQEIDLDCLQVQPAQVLNDTSTNRSSVVVKSLEIEERNTPVQIVDEPITSKRNKKGKGQRNTAQNSDDLQTQVFNLGNDNVAAADPEDKSVLRRKRGGRTSLSTNQTASKNVQSGPVSLVSLVSAACSGNKMKDSAWKSSDASKLLDVLSTQVFNVESQVLDEPATGSAVRGPVTNVFDDEAVEKLQSADEMPAGKRCASKKKGRLPSKRVSEIEDEVSHDIRVENKKTRVDCVEETGSSRRQLSRSSKGKN
jgi:hypothetical protein